MTNNESDLEGLMDGMVRTSAFDEQPLPPVRHRLSPWWAKAVLLSIIVLTTGTGAAIWSRTRQQVPLTAHMEVHQEEKQQILGVNLNPPTFDLPKLHIRKINFGFSTPHPGVGYLPLNASIPATQSAAGTFSTPLPAQGATEVMMGDAKNSLPQAIPMTTPVPCGRIENGINYPGNDIDFITNVPSAEACCKACTEYHGCLAWTWGAKRGEAYSDNCYLKGNKPRSVLFKVEDASFVSGQTLHGNWIISAVKQQPGQSLYCFALALPNSYELELLGMQYQSTTSLFACDEYTVYSNQKMEIAPGVMTGIVQSDLKCRRGGEFKTALNTDIFLRVWDKVIADGRFQYHDWTVKVDPDAVFFPERLRNIVVSHREYQGGVFLNNCHRGLHGPLEVFSRIAVYVWKEGRERCLSHFQQQCSGPCRWGEDMFIDQCLQFLKVTRENDWNLLIEEACDPPLNWNTCQSPNKNIVSFHPYKTMASYAQCMNNALL